MLKRQVLRQMHLAVLIFLLFFSPPYGVAASVAGLSSWENLHQLETGQLVKVVLKDTKAYEGEFQALTEESIQLLNGEQNRTFLKSDVLRISTKKAGHRGRNALIGVGLGTAAGLGVGAATAHEGEMMRGVGIGLGAALGAIGGAALGAVIPTGGWEEIYRNP
ncbi:MAG TPA: hypothetical protein VMW38_14275 [Terriglobia bacterium]|nr:hypothetical protein [Terriglobia bacterium]